MTELAGGELCLPQRPHNQVGVARIRRLVYILLNSFVIAQTIILVLPSTQEISKIFHKKHYKRTHLPVFQKHV